MPARTAGSLLDRLGGLATAAGEKNPGLEVVALFVDSASEVIRLDEARRQVGESRVHLGFWVVFH